MPHMPQVPCDQPPVCLIPSQDDALGFVCNMHRYNFPGGWLESWSGSRQTNSVITEYILVFLNEYLGVSRSIYKSVQSYLIVHPISSLPMERWGGLFPHAICNTIDQSRRMITDKLSFRYTHVCEAWLLAGWISCLLLSFLAFLLHPHVLEQHLHMDILL